MTQHKVASLISLLLLSACGGPPQPPCISAGLLALGEAGIFGDAQASDVTPLQCAMVKRSIEQRGCDINAYRFMAEQPTDAIRMFVPGTGNISRDDIQGMRQPAVAVLSACDW